MFSNLTDMMNKILAIICFLTLMAAPAANAKVAVVRGQVPVSGISVDRAAQSLMLAMDLEVAKFPLSKDRQLELTPIIYNADSTECHEFAPVLIAGRNLYYKHLRDNDLSDSTEMHKKGTVSTLSYRGQAPDADWFNDSRLAIRYRVCGCCNSLIEQGVDLIAPIRKPVQPTFKPMFNYVTPVGDSIKTFEIKKTAYIDFRVDKTNIDPNYRRNPDELFKIQMSIDSVRSDKDVTITAVGLKGFASPESPYKHNTDLAIGRVNALKQHIQQLYHFPAGVITTDYEPEDWAGLRRFVEGSNIEHRNEILEIIDSDLAPDPKEAKIKKLFPQQYKFMLQNWYPALRHTDYKIDYTVRNYSTLEEILKILATAPQKLSLSEFFRAAQSMTPGSPEYNSVFETAVHFFPTSEVANLNAANAAMGRGDLQRAEYYLQRAGDGPEAIYARGILAALSEDYPAAKALFQQAAKLKVADAPAALEEVDAIIKWQEEQADPTFTESYININ